MNGRAAADCAFTQCFDGRFDDIFPGYRIGVDKYKNVAPRVARAGVSRRRDLAVRNLHDLSTASARDRRSSVSGRVIDDDQLPSCATIRRCGSDAFEASLNFSPE